jgi:hypothetical protein
MHDDATRGFVPTLARRVVPSSEFAFVRFFVFSFFRSFVGGGSRLGFLLTGSSPKRMCACACE